MSNVLPEGQDAVQAPGLPSSDPQTQVTAPMARYTIHVPVYDHDKNEIPHVLAAVRQAMTDMGLEGRIVIRRAQGDWKDFATEEVDLVMTDAPDSPDTDSKVQQIGAGVKQLSGQESVYITKQPIQAFLV